MKENSNVQKGKGFAYVDKHGRLCMIRCFECGKENWAPRVATGTCAWCGHDPNPEPPNISVYKGRGGE